MYHRILSFETGLLQCKATFDSNYCLAEKVSKLITQDIIKAVKAHKDGGKYDYKDGGQYFLKAVETLCRPIGYSNKAADCARKNTWQCETTLVLLLSFLQQVLVTKSVLR